MNTTDKLTPQESRLTASEAALYLGQDIKVSAKNGEYTTGTLVLVSSLFNRINVECDKFGLSDWDLSKAKAQLLLRPLSDISEEEAKELSAYMSLRPTVREMAKYTNTLRGFGIDCDGFIEQGKAIDKTKQNNG